MTKEQKKRLIAQLHNHNQSNINALSDDELVELFKKVSMDWTKNIVHYNSDTKSTKNINLDEIEERIKSEIFNSNNFYETFSILLQQYPYESIYEVIIGNINSNTKLLEKILFILEIKYRQYQEILLENIEQKIDFMPQEEVATFVNFIESKRDDTELLKNILLQLQDTSIASYIDKITNIKKYILSHFLPQDLESNYKSFFLNSQDKQELINKLKDISNAYSQRQLSDMTKEDLVDILASIKQKEISEKRDKEDYEKYLELFKKALYEDDNDTFNALVVQVIEDVSRECLFNLKNTLREEDALFESKFQAAQKEWSKFK